jgi:hypothetical protein
MVREKFPDQPRAHVRIAVERGLGKTMRSGDACALVPLTTDDAQLIVAATPARRAADQRALADLLERVAACAVDEDALFELEIHIGAEPAVVSAQGSLRRPSSAA